MSSQSLPLHQPGLLRWALLLDALASGLCGLLFVAMAPALAGWLMIPAALLHWVGLGLLPYALLVGMLAKHSNTLNHAAWPRRATWGVVAINLLWVFDSAVLLLSGWILPNALGTAFIVTLALVVGLFAGLQYIGLRSALQS